MKNAIAELTLLGTRQAEKPFVITLQIGTPYSCGKEADGWACPISVFPLAASLHDAHGRDSFQALCLAISMAQDLLHRFRTDGGTLSYQNGGLFPLEAYFFSFLRWT